MGALTTHAIDFTRNTRWEDLPVGVQHQAKRCLLDTLGALIAGTQTPVAAIMGRIAKKQFSGDQATMLVSGDRVSAAGAALANGFAANALDIDDGYRNVKGHPGACALPPVMIAAEMAGTCTGQEMLTAFVVAYERGIRAGVIRHATYEVYHSSGSWGAIAGAAAAGRLLELPLMARVVMEADPEMEREFPAKAPAQVILETVPGEIFRSGRMEALWEPPDTLPSDPELEAKFQWLVGPVLGEDQTRRLTELIWQADQLASIDTLVRETISRS